MSFLLFAACTDGDVYFQNETYDYNDGLSTNRGRVLVCVNGTIQPICDIGWDNTDAQVVCNQRYGSRYGKNIICDSIDDEVMLCWCAVGEVLSPSLPITLSEIYIGQDVTCNGTEYSLSQCDYNSASPACYMGNRSAGVVCREGEHHFTILSYLIAIMTLYSLSPVDIQYVLTVK